MPNNTNQTYSTSDRITDAAEVPSTTTTLTSEKSLIPNESETRARLLRNAAEKPIGRYVQFDYFPLADEMFGCVRDELRSGSNIRLQLPLGTSKEAALKALAGFREMVEKAPDILNEDESDHYFYQWNYDENN
jgi:hypothetical protein